MEAIIETIRLRGYFEFSYQGKTYLIQTENNKGWNYLSLWCTAPGLSCMRRVFFDGFDGVPEETVQELFDQPFSEEHTLREIVQEILIYR